MVEKAPIRVSYDATNGTRETTLVSELSLGGVVVETQLKSPRVGALVSLEIESGSTKVAIDGRVLSHNPRGFAVSFIDLPNDVASSLSFILATKMPRRGTQLGLGEAEQGVSKYVSEPRLPVIAPSAPAPIVGAAPPSAKPAPAIAVPEVDEAAPRHPTPRIMPAAPPSQPGATYGAPPAPTSSAPAVMLPSGPHSRPPSVAPISMPPPAGSNRGLVIAIVIALLVIGIAAAVALGR